MSAAGVVCRRALAHFRSLYCSAFAYAAYLAGSGALFAFNLESAEASRASAAAVWALSAAPFLPLAAAFAGMHSWSAERASGAIDLLLSAPVRERELAAGKFFGAWIAALAAVALFFVSSAGMLAAFSPKLYASLRFVSFLPGFLALAMQAAAWCAVAVFASACSVNAAAAAAATVALTAAIPRLAWAAFAAWSPEGRSAFGDFPLDAHVFDFASGVVSTGVAVSYFAFTWFFLFACSKRVALMRLAGRRNAGERFAIRLSVVLAFVFAGLAASLAWRLDATLDLPSAAGAQTRFSPRTRNILADARGGISAIAFLPRSDRRWRETARFLRSLERESREVGGVGLAVRFVDPGLDLGEARRLAAAGVSSPAVAFERDGRISGSISIDGDFGERAVASAIERIASPVRRRAIYWTAGHGETMFDDYGAGGMSDIARDLALDGYTSRKLSLSRDSIADDCALVVAAGPRTGFSQLETEKLAAYLDGRGGGEGGRFMYLAQGPDAGGALAQLLAARGIRISGEKGGEIVADGLDAAHPVTKPLCGEQILFDRPAAFEPSGSADAKDAHGADRTRFAKLVAAGGACFAAASERGAAGADLAVRPTRIVAIGDAGFVSNGALRTRANANRDFFLNAVKFLSGSDSTTDAGVEADRLVTGMDKTARRRFAACCAGIVPLAVLLAGFAIVAGKRRRR